MSAEQCRAVIEKELSPGRRIVYSRRRCHNKTRHLSGYCHLHRREKS